MEDLDLLSLRCFLAAARHLNFRAASASMYLSPAAFGQRIAGLEESLGQRLFERSTRRVRLTPEGAAAVPRARRILEECLRFQHEIAAPGTTPYAITLGTRFELGLSWLTPALDLLSERRPQRTLHLSFGDSEDMITRVRSGQVDAAVTSSRRLPPGSQQARLHDEHYAFVGAPQLLAEVPLEKASDAARHTLLDIRPTRPLFRYFMEESKGNAAWSFGGLHCLGTIAAIRMRVLAGHGVAVLPRYFIAGDLAEGTLVANEDLRTLSDAFRLVWLADHPLVEPFLELAEELRAIPLA